MPDLELYQRWAELTQLLPNTSLSRAAEHLRVRPQKLEACIRDVERLDTRTPAWLVAQCLRIRADELEVDLNLDQADLLRARADEIDEGARVR
ncbi:hypothetical protein [Tenggerimyces flavus]|uniref:Uncharacterized protein n=1 Tax=Tenggerimyces flavus TaxID=1708749 RepID=A0ABV7YDE4_9ACTN|nr:hypothetical protein [Tenggerimyces flavus]MBM7788886.1 hypothetical protein [Tenggerimyces flavus]